MAGPAARRYRSGEERLLSLSMLLLCPSLLLGGVGPTRYCCHSFCFFVVASGEACDGPV